MSRVASMATSLVTVAMTVCCSAADWAGFRGGAGNSVAVDTGGATAGQIKQVWKSELPGRGPASPIVVGGRVIVTCSSGYNQDRLHVLCFDAADGRKLWQRQFWATGRTLSHPFSANAAPTPASDGKSIFAFFSSNDLACLDLDGNLKWFRGLAHDYPRVGNDAGMSSSPVVVGETVIVQVENQGDSFAAGIDTATGENRWRIEREPLASWASPIVMRGSPGKPDVVLLQSATHLSAHEPATGRQLWDFKAGCDGISSAANEGGLVYLPSNGVTALDPSGGGSEPVVVWKAGDIKPGAASPVVHGGHLLAIDRGGMLVCADAKTGDVLSRLRLQGKFWSTPAMAGSRAYCFSEEGVAQVVELNADGRDGKVASTLDLGETILSSPAIADGAVYIRSDHHLWKLQ